MGLVAGAGGAGGDIVVTKGAVLRTGAMPGEVGHRVAVLAVVTVDGGAGAGAVGAGAGVGDVASGVVRVVSHSAYI